MRKLPATPVSVRVDGAVLPQAGPLVRTESRW